MALKILVVDDESEIRNVVTKYLENEGYNVIEAQNGVDAVKMFQDEKPDLVVLDLMLPDIPGEKVCSVIRDASDIPILMLTAKTSTEDRIEGLTLGADDYLVKPFSPKELVVRIRNILKRIAKENPKQKAVTSKELTIDEAGHIVKKNGKEVRLTPIEFKLLLTMSNSPNRIFTRDQLIDTALGYEYEGMDRTIDSHIKNLRHKIEDNANRPQYIRTVFGVGYKFTEAED